MQHCQDPPRLADMAVMRNLRVGCLLLALRGLVAAQGDWLERAMQKPAASRPAAAPAKPAAAPAQPAGGQSKLQAGLPPAAQAGSSAFRMDLPPGWRAQLANGAVVARGGEEAVVIAPVSLSGRSNAADWLRRAGAAALSAYLPQPVLTAVQPSRSGNHVALASLDYAGAGSARVLCFFAGNVGTLYVVAGPRAAFAQRAPALVRMIRSFSFGGETAAAAPARTAVATGVQYRRFRDPHEGAFSVDVPAGWTVEGGLVRKSSVDTRSYVLATSPDGASVLRFGDASIGTFVLPSPMMAMTGFREGMTYSPGYGNVQVVSRYFPGPAFAREYVNRFTRDNQAGNVQIREVKPLPELDKQVQFTATTMQTSGGEADFTCQRQGRDCAGTVVAATTLLPLPSSPQDGLWYVSSLAAFVAPTEQVARMVEIAHHVIASIEIDPQWAARQGQLTMQTSRIVSETNDHVSRIIHDTYENRSRAQDRANRNFDDYIRGVVRLRDPNSGEELEGVAGKNYYYRQPGDHRTVGTDVELRSPDLTELEQIH